MQANKKIEIRKITVTAIMSAMATILMFFPEFPLPTIIPDFIKFDFSEIPALITTFAFGPIWGVAVCFIKNVIHMIFKFDTLGIGELSNFILGAMFVFVAGALHKKHNKRKLVVVDALIGDLAMAIFCWFSNVFLIYPAYIKFLHFPEPALLGAYQAILPSVQNLKQAILIFNVPFTFVKGLASVVFATIVFSRISPLFKNEKQK